MSIPTSSKSHNVLLGDVPVPGRFAHSSPGVFADPKHVLFGFGGDCPRALAIFVQIFLNARSVLSEKLSRAFTLFGESFLGAFAFFLIGFVHAFALFVEHFGHVPTTLAYIT